MARCPKCSVSFRVREDEQLDITECPACGYSEKEEVYGECAGCGENIVAGDEYYEIETTVVVSGAVRNETIMVHQDKDCCQTYVSEMSWCRTAG